MPIKLQYVLTWKYQDDRQIIGIFDSFGTALDAQEKAYDWLKNCSFFKDWIDEKPENEKRPYIMNMLDIHTMQQNLIYYENLQ